MLAYITIQKTETKYLFSKLALFVLHGNLVITINTSKIMIVECIYITITI